MAGRKVRDAADARACLDAAEASGLTRAAWARQQGIDGRSLNAWHNNLARRASGESSPATMRLVELVPTAHAAPAPVRYVVRCGEFAVEVDARFEDETLARLLRVVSSC
jgi:hypothetical protein